MKRFAFFLFLFSACKNRDAAVLLSYYSEESGKRAEWLAGHNTDDSAFIDYFRRETADIILLSKDTENPEASVFRASRLFDSTCARYAIPRSDFTDIAPGMSDEETELQLRENELGFLNRIVMLRSGKEGFIFTAH